MQRNRQNPRDHAARPLATPGPAPAQKPKGQAGNQTERKGPKGQGPKGAPPPPRRQAQPEPAPIAQGDSHASAETTADGQPVQVVVGDWAALVRLFERASPVSMSHWNPLTGQTFELPRGKQRRTTGERFEHKLMREDDDGAAWAEIPYEESDTEYRRALAFAEGLRPGAGRAELLAALHGPKPFRAFRTVLGHHPGLERRWASVSSQAAEERLAEFCLAQGWRLVDERFDAAVERWLEAEERADGEGDDEEEFSAPRLVVRSAQQLSLGRRSSGEDS